MDSKEKKFSKVQEGQIEIPLARVQILIDVIFASAMTLMVLSFKMPDTGREWTNKEIFAYLQGQLKFFAIFLVTLAVIAVYWLKHLEHFSFLKSTSQLHLWLQLFYIGFLVLLPFTNNFTIHFPDNRASQFLYCGNMFFIGFFSVLSWNYATKNHRLVDPRLDKNIIKTLRDEALVEPAIALLALPAAFVSAELSRGVLLLIPAIFVIQKKWEARKRKQLLKENLD